MFKSSTICLIISLCLIQYIFADCIDGKLYCFNSNQIRLGEIVVGQCWNWRSFSCEPCGMSKLIKKRSRFHRYLLVCRHYFPNTVLVLQTKSVWATKVKEIINSY